MSHSIKTRDVQHFMRDFTTTEAQLMLEQDFEQFFVVPVEEMFQTMRLPIPATKSTIHSLIFLTEGTAEMSIGSQTYTISSNECLVVPAGQVFSFKNPDHNKGYLCCFHPAFLHNYGKHLPNFDFLHVWGEHKINFEANFQAIESVLTRLLDLYKLPNKQQTPRLQAYLMSLLFELQSVYVNPSSLQSLSAMQITRDFRALLLEHITSIHRVASYAERLHISPNHLNKVIKKTTGKSPILWIEETLTLEAKVLLFHSSLTVQEIAFTLGFEDASYFSRLFKKIEGQSPIQFRKMIDISKP